MIKKVYCGGKNYRIENIYCIGRNYSAHIAELQHEKDSELMAFIKPNSALVGEESLIHLPLFSQEIDYECEVVVLIRKAQNHQPTVAGFALGIDLTARDLQRQAIKEGLPWLKCKGFKASALISKFIDVSLIANWQAISFSLSINGRTVQQGNTNAMLYPIQEIVTTLDKWYGLQEGDIIYTGTPQGVGQVRAGDRLELNLENTPLHAHFQIAS